MNAFVKTLFIGILVGFLGVSNSFIATSAQAIGHDDFIYRRITADLKCEIQRTEANLDFVVKKIEYPEVSIPQQSSLDSTSGFTFCDAGLGIAIAYDGFQVKVFDATANAFFPKLAVDSFLKSKISAGSNIAALYDGSNFVVYDKSVSAFQSTFANRTFADSVIAAGENVAILYDGSDVWAYNGSTHLFERDYATRFANPSALVLAGRNVAIAFDGETLHGYCSDRAQWVQLKFRTDGLHTIPAAMPLMDQSGEHIGMFIDRVFYTLDRDTCQFQQI